MRVCTVFVHGFSISASIIQTSGYGYITRRWSLIKSALVTLMCISTAVAFCNLVRLLS